MKPSRATMRTIRSLEGLEKRLGEQEKALKRVDRKLGAIEKALVRIGGMLEELKAEGLFGAEAKAAEGGKK